MANPAERQGWPACLPACQAVSGVGTWKPALSVPFMEWETALETIFTHSSVSWCVLAELFTKVQSCGITPQGGLCGMGTNIAETRAC